MNKTWPRVYVHFDCIPRHKIDHNDMIFFVVCAE